MVDVLTGLGLALLVGILFLCRLTELTFVRLGRARARGLDEAAGDEGRLARLVAHRESALGPISIVRLACQIVFIATVAVAAANRTGVGGVVVALLGAGVGLYFLTESVPRHMALEANDRMSRTLAGVAAVFRSLAPLRMVSGGFERLARLVGPRTDNVGTSEVAEDELVALAAAAAEADLIEDSEAVLIGSVIELGDTIAREVMVPRPDMITVGQDDSVREALELIVSTGFSRIPIRGENSDDLLGLVLSKDLIAAQLAGRSDEPIHGLKRDLMFVPETKRVTELMAEMQDAKRHLAVVVDEYGGTAGLVALEDIIEEMVGEIIDEFDDEAPLIEDLGDGSLLVAGRTPIDDLLERVDNPLPEGDWDTVAGLVFDLAGHVPELNEVVRCDGFEFVVESLENRRIDKVRVTLVSVGGSIDDNPSLEASR